MSALVKILGILIISGILSVTLKKESPEYSAGIGLAAGVVATLLIFGSIGNAITGLIEKIEEYGIKTEYFSVALKALGIGYITSFVADACRDCGQTSLATKAELAGKCAIFVVSLPLLMTVLDIAVGFLK